VVTRATIVDILKTQYGEIYEQLNNEVRALDFMEESDTAEWTGAAFEEALHVGRNYSSKAVAEGGRLPNPQNQSYDKLTVPMRYIYGGISLSAQAIKSADKNEASFVNSLDSEIEGLITDGQVNQNRIMWGNGVGTLALVNDTTGGAVTSLTIDSPGGVAGAVNGARFIRPGMVLAFHDAAPASNTPNAVRTVLTVNAAGTVITLASINNSTEAPNNGIITVGVDRTSTLEGSWNLEPMGLLGIIDEGTFTTNIHGVDRTASPGDQFVCQSLASVGVLDEFMFHDLNDMADQASGRMPDKIMTHHSVHREYIRAGLGDKRYTGEMAGLPDLGIRGGGSKRELQFSGDTIMKERFCPYGFMYGIDSKALKRYTQVEGEWIDEDGAILHRGDGAIDSFEAQHRMWKNFGAKRCNSSWRASGITATVNIVNAA
jgi:hypothetical protein